MVPKSNFTTLHIAGGGVDYTSGPYIVTFPPGVTITSFDVPINDDNILEIDENFILTINSSSLPDNVINGNSHQVTLTVEDNDRK